MKKFLKSLIMKIVTFLILIYVGITIINQQQKIDSYSSNISYLNEEIKDANSYNAQLEEMQENINSEEYIEVIAREKLNMYKSNEKVYMDIGK